MERADLVILGATPGEVAPLVKLLRAAMQCKIGFGRSIDELKIAGNLFSIFIYGDLKLLIGTTGIGKVNAAAVTAAVLSRIDAAEVWNIGCAGSYVGSELEIGDVLISERCICADEGILGKEGPLPNSALGIPLYMREGKPFYDFFPLSQFLSFKRTGAVLPAGVYTLERSGGVKPVESDGEAVENRQFRVKYGPSVTVAMASGDLETAEARFIKFRGLAEDMEGSAVAQTSFLFEVPCLEFRGISNRAGIRDKSKWKLVMAIEHCLAVIFHLLRERSGTEI